MKFLVAALILACPASALAQRLEVRIVDRQNNETDYTYVVPGRFSSWSDSSANCNVNSSNVNCNGSTTTNGYSMPAHQVSYHVRGATYALLLPDGRVAVVNCESKFAEHFAGHAGNRRNCRQPLVDNIQANFHGGKAKLEWIVSLDGKKTASETYNILAVLGTEDRDTVATVQDQAKAAAPSNSTLTDVITWFDETAPGPTTEVRDVIITARGYDGVVSILRTLRGSDTAVKSGVSILDIGYHPASLNLAASLLKNQTVTVFHWDDETLSDTTLVMHLRITRRAYDNVTNAIGHLQASTFTKP